MFNSITSDLIKVIDVNGELRLDPGQTRALIRVLTAMVETLDRQQDLLCRFDDYMKRFNNDFHPEREIT